MPSQPRLTLNSPDSAPATFRAINIVRCIASAPQTSVNDIEIYVLLENKYDPLKSRQREGQRTHKICGYYRSVLRSTSACNHLRIPVTSSDDSFALFYQNFVRLGHVKSLKLRDWLPRILGFPTGTKQSKPAVCSTELSMILPAQPEPFFKYVRSSSYLLLTGG